jgi:hypothetical protein
MKNYKGITYEYREWRTYDNTLASGYQCSDDRLLSGLSTTSFGTRNEDEMKVKISFYLDNRQALLDAEELTKKAIASTYEIDEYKLD